MKKDSFLLYTEQIEVFNSLTDEQAGQLIKAIYQYNKTGELPELNDILKIAIIPIKQQLDRNALKYEETREKRKLAGAKGGKQKVANVANAKFAKQNVANQADNVNDNVNENEHVNVNVDVNKKKEFKKFNQNNPDLMFDKRINKVFELYKEKCPNLCPLVFEERNLERRQQVKDLLILCQYDMGYIEGLFNRANEQITFYDDKISFQSLIKNHEKIYQGLGAKKQEPKEIGNSMDKMIEKWEREAQEREMREESRLK